MNNGQGSMSKNYLGAFERCSFHIECTAFPKKRIKIKVNGSEILSEPIVEDDRFSDFPTRIEKEIIYENREYFLIIKRGTNSINKDSYAFYVNGEYCGGEKQDQIVEYLTTEKKFIWETRNLKAYLIKLLLLSFFDAILVAVGFAIIDKISEIGKDYMKYILATGIILMLSFGQKLFNFYRRNKYYRVRNMNNNKNEEI